MTRPDANKLERVAVIGAGTIGASWASLLLARGLEVSIYDPRSDIKQHVTEFIENAWPSLERLGLDKSANASKITFADTAASAVDGAWLIQENGPENLETKRALYASFESALHDESIVASSTSGLMPSELQQGRLRPERYLVGHPFNPPHLIPLVEVVGGQQTEPQVVDWALAFYQWMGKKAIRIDREVPGHVANRMAIALYREAIHLVLEGVATPADVDAAISYGPGIRWALMGPHALHEVGGGKGGMRHQLENVGDGINTWWDDLGAPRITAETITRLEAAYAATNPPAYEQLVEERDALLVEILALKNRGSDHDSLLK